MCVDYRTLNVISKNYTNEDTASGRTLRSPERFPLASKLDLRQGYNQVRIRVDDIEKTTISILDTDHFEYRVLPFGLRTAPATFLIIMQRIFADMMYVCVVVLFQWRVVFTRTEEAHARDVC